MDSKLHFNISQQSTLTSQQLQKLKLLTADCYQHDGYLPEMHWSLLSSPSNFESTFIASGNNQMIGYLRFFFFFEFDVEMLLFVDPNYRRQGVARELLHQAINLLSIEKIQTLRFSLKSKDANWLVPHQGQYHYTDYGLQHDLHDLIEPTHIIQESTTNDLDALLRLDKLCFENSNLTALRFSELVTNDDYLIISINHNQTPVAKLHLHYFAETAEIYDVAVDPVHRCKGYASSLIQYALKQAANKQKSPVRLNVTSSNEKALSLYQKLGFKHILSRHFWRLPLVKAMLI